MPNNTTELCADISLRADEIAEAIAKLMSHQDDIQEDILKLQRGKRKGETIDEGLLAELKEVRKKVGNEIGLLSIERTELFDDLPVIRMATGKLKVVASELEKDAQLVETTAKKIQEVTKKVQKSEKLILKVISLINKI